MRTDLQNWLLAKDIRDLPLRQMHAVMAARFCCICNKVGRDPIDALSVRFRSVSAAKTFISLVEAVGHAWPEPFLVMRPCCSGVSIDEGVLSDMINAAARADRMRFDAILCDMIAPNVREKLFDMALKFAGAFDPQRIGAD